MNYKNLIIIFCIIAFIPALSSCNKKETKPSKVLRPVKYITVKKELPNNKKTFAGTVKANITSNLSFQQAGTIKDIYVCVGDYVKKGEVLAILDSESNFLKVQKAKAAYNMAKINAKNSKKDYERISQLYINQNISKSQYDKTKTNAETQASNVKLLKKSLELAELFLEYTKLTSPVNGYVSSKNTEIGENLKSQITVLTVVSDDIPVISVNIPEQYIGLINYNTPVTTEIGILNNQTFKGRIIELGVASSSNSTTFPLTITLLEQNKFIKSGMSANVELTLSKEQEPKIYLPINAITEDQNGKYVFVLKEIKDHTAKIARKNIKIGKFEADKVEIISGLSNSDKVVTAGVSRIINGQVVKFN